MLIKPGIAVAQMSGKFGGVVASHNRGGMYFRKFSVPTDPNTPRQQSFRSYMSLAVAAWKSMTDSEQAAWSAYAAATPWVNAIGDTIYLTGMQQFLRSEVIVQQLRAGGAGITSPVTCTSAGGLPAQFKFGASTLSVTTGLSVGFEASDAWCEEDMAFAVVSMGRPRPASQLFDSGPKRFVDRIDGDSLTPATSPQVTATVSLPWPVIVGQRVTLYARVMRADGTLSELAKSEVKVVS